MKEYRYNYLGNGSQKYKGLIDDNVTFVMGDQLKNERLWQKFIDVFAKKSDDKDNGWRGEYFGKMMRGACLTYKYRPDEELYEILSATVRNLLETQDGFGRITTYSVDKEFNGWDMWVRKYVIVGCLYFYGICHNDMFKTEILSAMTKHVDYLISKIGKENGKISILDTSMWYGGLNSSSILEPIVELYKLTGERRFIDFAKYILSEGGCKGGNLIELALSGEKMPFQYPEVKAYEMMSFFEGALAYYEVTGEEKYFNAVTKFVDAVLKSDITIIGSAGCTHELFDNSAEKQSAEVDDGTIMQETCVTVTWMRLQERLLRLTGEEMYAENIEKSAYNALNGSLNLFHNEQFCREEEKFLPGVTFDSYSPLVFQPRGIGIGGFRKFDDGTYYGCCACIGSAGVSLFPLASVYKTSDGFVFDYFHGGEIDSVTLNGQKITFKTSGEGVVDGKCEISLNLCENEKFTLSLREPKWSVNPKISVNGEEMSVKYGYNRIERVWKNGDKITLEIKPELKMVALNGKTAFTFGAFTLARDEGKEVGDIKEVFTPITENGKLVYEMQKPQKGESVRLLLKTKEGDVLLTDYASCGKHWREKRNRISAWLNVRV